MIRKLRLKFLAAAMLSLLAVLVVIMSTVNILNYRSIVQQADHTLALLQENGGNFPMRDSSPNQPHKQQKALPELPPSQDRFDMSPEFPYETRFFQVTLSVESGNFSANTQHIAAIDQQTAVQMAAQVIQKGKVKGFCGNYRYVIGKNEDANQVFFLDCTRDLSSCKTFLWVSCVISLAGFAAVFVLLLFLSRRIVKPISESYEKQRQFITDAGHEIKTPLTIIDADAEVLELELADNEWLQDIRKQTKRLSTLTNDLIYLSRMQEDERQIQKIEFPLSDVVQETVQSFASLAKMQHKELVCDTEKLLSFCGDEKAIRQLVGILLDNALKYSPEQTQIGISLKKQGRWICLQVSNIAQQLDRKALGRMFDRFYRADPARSSKIGGYGIGLSIAKAVVAAHKGKIAAACSNENLLTVTVQLPNEGK